MSDEWKKFLRSLGVAVLTSMVIIAFLIVYTRGQRTEESELQTALVELQEATLDATLAEACVLALPVDPVVGRDSRLVKQCFTQYSLEPPGTLDG
jgi:hypothetical protein